MSLLNGSGDFCKDGTGILNHKAIREHAYSPGRTYQGPAVLKDGSDQLRNLMIYFGPTLQKKVLPILHYALNPTGYLMLGRSESIGGLRTFILWSTKTAGSIPKKHHRQYCTSTGSRVCSGKGPRKEKSGRACRKRPDFQKEADSIILDRYSPADWSLMRTWIFSIPREHQPLSETPARQSQPQSHKDGGRKPRHGMRGLIRQARVKTLLSEKKE